jgi:rubrerythrin
LKHLESKEPTTVAKNRKNAREDEADLVARGLTALLYEALETEIGGVEVYLNALPCALHPELRSEWEKYLAETREHVRTVEELLEARGLDPARDTPERQIVRMVGKSLVKAMQTALGSVHPEAAQVIAAECVVLAETKDHSNWSVLAKFVAESDESADDLAAAVGRVESEEDEHLYHTQGWVRELRKQALGLSPALPPPEEVNDVESAKEAAQVREADE